MQLRPHVLIVQVFGSNCHSFAKPVLECSEGLKDESERNAPKMSF